MNPTYQDFMDNMNGIYGKFEERRKELLAQGTLPEDMVWRREGCYAIAFRHSKELTVPLGAYSALVGGAVPAMVYEPEKIQTTVTPYALVDLFRGQPDDPAIEILSRAIEYALEGIKYSVLDDRGIDFQGLFFSRGVVMAPGWPNEAQFRIVQALLVGCRRAGFEPRGPWGSQCMMNRFLREVPPDQLETLFLIMKVVPEILYGGYTSQPVSIAVLDNTILPDGQFECTVHKEWDLC